VSTFNLKLQHLNFKLFTTETRHIMAKRIIYNENARRALEKGMDILG
jgi:hypothetical protein